MYDHGDIENLKKYENISIKIFLMFVSDSNIDDYLNFKRINFNTENSYVKTQYPTLSDRSVRANKYPLMWISWCKRSLSMESKRNSYKTTYNGFLKRDGRYKWKEWMSLYKYVDDNKERKFTIGLHELGIYEGDGRDHVNKIYDFIQKYESKYNSKNNIINNLKTRDVGTQTIEKISFIDRNREAQQRYREKNREKLRINSKKYYKKKEPSELDELDEPDEPDELDEINEINKPAEPAEPAADSLADANAGGESGAEILGLGGDPPALDVTNLIKQQE